jgi:hypothetical protein
MTVDLIEDSPMWVRDPATGELVDADCVRLGGFGEPLYILARERLRRRYDDGKRLLFSRAELWVAAIREPFAFGDWLRQTAAVKIATGNPGARSFIFERQKETENNADEGG